MKYECEACGEVFNDPYIKRVRENLDGEHGWWSYAEAFCPVCGSAYFEEVNE